MGRPQIFLKDWCLEDSLLKAEFLKKESENQEGLVRRTNGGYIPNLDIYPQFQLQDSIHGILSNGMQIWLSPSCYEKLKAKFRTFKKKVKDKNKVKKQYQLNKETANFLSAFKEQNHYDREEVVVEYLVTKYQNQKLQFEHFDKLDRSSIRVQHLKNELDHCKKLCAQNESDKLFLQVHVNELNDLLARAYLFNEFLKETLKEHEIEYYQPVIKDDDVEKYKAEIRNNLRTYLK
ncbi:hypothetical protein F895_03288 [Acinetobacter sp. CIP 64.2]|jgi:hypothetical protein|uniref:hypothetical protein n=1 Tax=Acinetobacter sp. CIP 64.2 TaxID=1217694 RepID=UPI000289690D|nr:hypothetical protein [Acinetobacter sp. CIP 64.2]ENX12358.1 hypothetical protein F895_03288 [Acinetobacter sp. CIP 64.2]